MKKKTQKKKSYINRSEQIAVIVIVNNKFKIISSLHLIVYPHQRKQLLKFYSVFWIKQIHYTWHQQPTDEMVLNNGPGRQRIQKQIGIQEKQKLERGEKM